MQALWTRISQQISLGMRSRRSAALSSPDYDTGRPPGAPRGGAARRRYNPQDWELRDERFEELLESDLEDEDGQGVLVDPRSFAAREARARAVYRDDLEFMDYYDGRDRFHRHGVYDTYGDEYEGRYIGYRDQEGIAYQAAVRDKEQALINSALKRIRRAKEKKDATVKLSVEEAEAMEAFERRIPQQPERSEPKSALNTPPATPAKSTPKAKVSSRSNSSSNLAGKTRKRTSSGFFTSTPSPAKSNSKAKVNRKSSDENAGGHTTSQESPYGPMIPAHMAYYRGGPPSPELSRSQPVSRSGSRSNSKNSREHRRRDSTPPERASQDYYPQQHSPLRYHLPPAPLSRPESSGSMRSLPDDPDWQGPSHSHTYPPPAPREGGRHRSASNLQYAYYPPSDYELPPPAAQGPRRMVSGPSGVSGDPRYMRRVPGAGSSPLAARPLPAHASRSDPLGARSGLHVSQQVDGSSASSASSSDENEGVQVEVRVSPEREAGYAVERVSSRELEPEREREREKARPVGGNEGRKRRSGRR